MAFGGPRGGGRGAPRGGRGAPRGGGGRGGRGLFILISSIWGNRQA